MEILDDLIIRFPHGLPGFQEETSFVLLDLPNDSLFQVLQSTQKPELAFVIANPYEFEKEYHLKLDQSIIDLLNIESQKEVAVFGIVTVKEPFTSSTINLKAPLIFNVKEKLAKQYILQNDIYKTKTPITKGD